MAPRTGRRSGVPPPAAMQSSASGGERTHSSPRHDRSLFLPGNRRNRAPQARLSHEKTIYISCFSQKHDARHEQDNREIILPDKLQNREIIGGGSAHRS